MQHHTVQQFTAGPREGKWFYSGGTGTRRYTECCADAWLEMMRAPASERDTSPAWERIGHDTAEEAYAHMRTVLLSRLRLDTRFTDWSGCHAPQPDGTRCDTPTKAGAEIPPIHLTAPLCDQHHNRETVEAMWPGPGDWSGSW